jgi:hypothetical protein
MKKYFLIAAALLVMSAGAKAQVTIGSTDNPHSFSILELVSGGERGMRLPQMTFCEQDELTAILKGLLTQAEKNAAQGLQIFNTDTECIETWNGSKWIQKCSPEGPRPKEEILFTIRTTTDGEIYYIPTSGVVGLGIGYFGDPHTYDWNVSVDGGAAVRAKSTVGSHDGIELTIPKAGKHQIRITPYDCKPTAGWGNAFGHSPFPGLANNQTNMDKLIFNRCSANYYGFCTCRSCSHQCFHDVCLYVLSLREPYYRR